MTETPLLGLPLVQPSQAQKHVTVNEALSRLDALTQLTILETTQTVPPGGQEGDCYAVPAGAVNEWAGQEGRLALYLNGGWTFLTPQTGWRAWLSPIGGPAMFDGAEWIAGTGAVSPNGAAIVNRVIEFDHDVTAGASSDTQAIIPASSLVFGVTGRVLVAITGTATTWRLGIDASSDDRYGSGLGLDAGSWLRGLTSSPQAYFAPTSLRLTGEGGDLASGRVRLAVHLAELMLPRA